LAINQFIEFMKSALEPRSQVLSKDIMMVITPWDLGSSQWSRPTLVLIV